MDQSVIKPQIQNVTKCNVSHFCALSEILKVSFQFNAKSSAIDQLTLGDRPVDRDRRVGHPCSMVTKHFWRTCKLRGWLSVICF